MNKNQVFRALVTTKTFQAVQEVVGKQIPNVRTRQLALEIWKKCRERDEITEDEMTQELIELLEIPNTIGFPLEISRQESTYV